MSNSQYPRTLFVLKYRENTYGDPDKENGNWGDADGQRRPLSSGLFNSARMVVDMLGEHGVPVKLVHVLDNNFIHRELHNFKADVVVIEAFWVTPAKFDELQRVCPNVKFVVRNHSETPFLANEGIAFDWMLHYARKKNVYMSANASRMLKETRFLIGLENPEWSQEQVDAKCPYLPNYYPIDDCPVDGKDMPAGEINIGCFGAVRPLKNTMLQAIAAMKFASKMGLKLRFHINGGRLEMGGAPILKNLYQLFSHFPQYDLINHPWMHYTDFKKLVGTMDMLMQVSFSETFNIVAADAVTSNVPTITSDEVPWSARLLQADPNSCDSMVEALERIYHLRRQNPGFNPSLMQIEQYNKRSVAEWLPFLQSLK